MKIELHWNISIVISKMKETHLTVVHNCDHHSGHVHSSHWGHHCIFQVSKALSFSNAETWKRQMWTLKAILRDGTETHGQITPTACALGSASVLEYKTTLVARQKGAKCNTTVFKHYLLSDCNNKKRYSCLRGFPHYTDIYFIWEEIYCGQKSECRSLKRKHKAQQ